MAAELRATAVEQLSEGETVNLEQYVGLAEQALQHYALGATASPRAARNLLSWANYERILKEQSTWNIVVWARLA
jgi:hypothetical protein